MDRVWFERLGPGILMFAVLVLALYSMPSHALKFELKPGDSGYMGSWRGEDATRILPGLQGVLRDGV